MPVTRAVARVCISHSGCVDPTKPSAPARSGQDPTDMRPLNRGVPLDPVGHVGGDRVAAPCGRLRRRAPAPRAEIPWPTSAFDVRPAVIDPRGALGSHRRQRFAVARRSPGPASSVLAPARGGRGLACRGHGRQADSGPLEVDVELPVGEPVGDGMGGVNRQRGLADPSGPVDRQDHHLPGEAGGRQEPVESGQFGLAAGERADDGGELAGDDRRRGRHANGRDRGVQVQRGVAGVLGRASAHSSSISRSAETTWLAWIRSRASRAAAWAS
jgi:hypothetical protein